MASNYFWFQLCFLWSNPDMTRRGDIVSNLSNKCWLLFPQYHFLLTNWSWSFCFHSDCLIFSEDCSSVSVKFVLSSDKDLICFSSSAFLPITADIPSLKDSTCPQCSWMVVINELLNYSDHLIPQLLSLSPGVLELSIMPNCLWSSLIWWIRSL